MKIDFLSEKVLNPKKLPYQDENKQELTFGSVLCNILAAHKCKDGRTNVKMFQYAEKCVEEKDIELDLADLKTIKDAVEQCEFYAAYVKGQVYLKLEDVRDEIKK